MLGILISKVPVGILKNGLHVFLMWGLSDVLSMNSTEIALRALNCFRLSSRAGVEGAIWSLCSTPGFETNTLI